MELARLVLLLRHDGSLVLHILGQLLNSQLYVFRIFVQWLRSFDQRVRESIDYAICLNSVGSWSSDLWMHVSKPPENPYIKQIFEV
jgi:hypothetical protein